MASLTPTKLSKWLFEDVDDPGFLYRVVRNPTYIMLQKMREAPSIISWEDTDRTQDVGSNIKARCIRIPKIPFTIRPYELTRESVRKLLIDLIQLAQFAHARGLSVSDVHEANVAWYGKAYYIDLGGLVNGTDYQAAGNSFIKFAYLCARYIDRIYDKSHETFNLDAMKALKGWYKEAAKLDYSNIKSWDSFSNYLATKKLQDNPTHWSDEYALLSPEELMKKGKFIGVNEMITSGDTLLDIGCNKGYLAHMFINRFKHICGMDKCEKSINIANQRHGSERVNFACFAFEEFIKNDHWQIDRYKADTVIALAVEHHFKNSNMKINDLSRALGLLSNNLLLIEHINDVRILGEAIKKEGFRVKIERPSVPEGRKLVLYEKIKA